MIETPMLNAAEPHKTTLSQRSFFDGKVTIPTLFA